MDFNEINYEEITQRVAGAVGGIFAISIADKELGKMKTKDSAGKESNSPFFEYRHYAYTVLGALLPVFFKPTKNKDDFSTKYAEGIQSFSNSLMFYGAAQLLEKQLPEYVNIAGVPEKFANYVMGATASTAYGMANYVQGACAMGEQVLVERETGDRVYIDPNTGQYVKLVQEQPAKEVIDQKSPQADFTVMC